MMSSFMASPEQTSKNHKRLSMSTLMRKPDANKISQDATQDILGKLNRQEEQHAHVDNSRFAGSPYAEDKVLQEIRKRKIQQE